MGRLGEWISPRLDCRVARQEQEEVSRTALAFLRGTNVQMTEHPSPTKDTSNVICIRNGHRFPRYFVGFRVSDKSPVLTFDARLAKVWIYYQGRSALIDGHVKFLKEIWHLDAYPSTITREETQKGYAELIGLLIMMVCCLVLAAAAVPALQRIQAGQNQSQAKTRILLIGNSLATAAQCSLSTPPCNTTSLLAIVPSPPSIIRQQGYQEVFTQAGASWTITESPLNSNSGVFSYFLDQTGVLRCGQGQVTSTSPSCQ